MKTAFAWIHQYRYFAILLLVMLGIVGLPISDETLVLLVGYLSVKGDLSALCPTALCREAHRCMNL